MKSNNKNERLRGLRGFLQTTGPFVDVIAQAKFPSSQSAGKFRLALNKETDMEKLQMLVAATIAQQAIEILTEKRPNMALSEAESAIHQILAEAYIAATDPKGTATQLAQQIVSSPAVEELLPPWET